MKVFAFMEGPYRITHNPNEKSPKDRWKATMHGQPVFMSAVPQDIRRKAFEKLANKADVIDTPVGPKVYAVVKHHRAAGDIEGLEGVFSTHEKAKECLSKVTPMAGECPYSWEVWIMNMDEVKWNGNGESSNEEGTVK